MKLIISISCVLALALMIPCQGKDVRKTIPDEVAEIKKEMERDMEMMREVENIENIFGGMDNKPNKEQRGGLETVWVVEILIGYPSNPTGVMNDDKIGDKHFDGSVIGNNKMNETIADNNQEEMTTDATEIPLIDKVVKVDDNQKELNETIVDEAELEKEIEIEIEIDLEEANEEEMYEELLSEEIKEIFQDEDILYETDNGHINEPKRVTGPKFMTQEIISDDEGVDDEHEGSGIEDQNKTIGMDSEMLKEVEEEIALEEDNEEFKEEIESMKIEGMNSEIKELQREEDNILEEVDILENTFIENNEAPAIHSANHATQDNKDQQLYSQSTMRLVFFISAGILMLSVLLLLVVLVVILTKKETVPGNPATRYVKRIRLVSNASTKSKEFLI